MTPRYASGVWWSIWMNYNLGDVQQIVSEYESRDLPLDVYILDMDWYVRAQILCGSQAHGKRGKPLGAKSV